MTTTKRFGVIYGISQANPREPFVLRGSVRRYYAHFAGGTKANPRGKYAGIRRMGGRPKIGRNAPGYRERARARGKLAAEGIRLHRDGFFRIEGVSTYKFTDLAEAKRIREAALST